MQHKHFDSGERSACECLTADAREGCARGLIEGNLLLLMAENFIARVATLISLPVSSVLWLMLFFPFFPLSTRKFLARFVIQCATKLVKNVLIFFFFFGQ